MAKQDAARRENSVRDKFESLTASLRAENPTAARWLEDARDDLTKIFGANLSDIWEDVTFLYYIWLVTHTAKRMLDEGTLPVLGQDAYERASREWSDCEARSVVQREILKAMSTFKYNVFEDFEGALHGAPLCENDAAASSCRGAFTKLLRMIRLSR